jgi:hypothetical protein
MRLSALVGIVAVGALAFSSTPFCAAEEPAEAAETRVPAVIVFSSGTWHLVNSLELKDGSIIYSKPGEYPRAVPEYKVDSRRTTDVNQALEELVEACLTDSVDIPRIAGLKGRSLEIFTDASNRTVPKCLAEIRDRSRRAEAADEERAKEESLSGLTDAEVSASLQQADKVVLTNRSVANTARRADGYSPKKKNPAGQGGDGGDFAPEVITEVCQDGSDVGTSQYQACYDRQAVALGRLKARTPGSVPKNAFSGIRAHCRNEWSQDYSKRDNCERDEIDGYHAVQRLATDPRYDPVFLNRARVECERAWSSQYTMQEVCLEEQLRGAQSGQ